MKLFGEDSPQSFLDVMQAARAAKIQADTIIINILNWFNKINPVKSTNFPLSFPIDGCWLVVYLPLWKIWVRQLRWFFPTEWKNKTCSKPPTNQVGCISTWDFCQHIKPHRPCHHWRVQQLAWSGRGHTGRVCVQCTPGSYDNTSYLPISYPRNILQSYDMIWYNIYDMTYMIWYDMKWWYNDI